MKLYFILLILLTNISQSKDLDLKTMLEKTQKEYKIPALAVSIISSPSIQNAVVGVNKIGSNHVVELTDKFHLGSNTKAITAFLAMKLIEQGQLSLNTSLYDLYPEFKDINPEFDDLTLKNILSHNAKIPAYTSGLAFMLLPKFDGKVKEKRYAFVAHVLTEKPVAKGTYSNAGYAIAALIIDKVSGMSYEKYLSQVMQDLELEHFIGFPNKENKDYPWGHMSKFFINTPLAPNDDYKLEPYIAAAGDMSMNIIDYAKFIQLNLNGLRGKNNYLKAKSYQKLHFGKENYAYGWGNQVKEDKTKVSYHDGSAGTYYCHTIVIPDDDIAIVIMMNTAKPNQVKGIYKLRKDIIKLLEVKNAR